MHNSREVRMYGAGYGSNYQGGGDYRGYGTKPPRGGCLVTFLAVLVGLNVIGGLFILSGAPVRIMAEMGEEVNRSVFIPALLTGFFEIICAVGIFLWKKWGLYGLFLVLVFSIVGAIFSGEGIGGAIFGALVLGGIAWYAVVPYWPDME